MVAHFFIMHQIKADALACHVIPLINIFNVQLICILLICLKYFNKLQKCMIGDYKS